MSFVVHVVNEEQEPREGARVALSFRGIPLLPGGMSGAEYTDSDGQAYFDGYDRDEIEVFLDGQSYGWYIYDDGDSITITTY